MITGGICLSYWLDFGFSFLDPLTIAWRFPIGFQIFFALAILLFVLELPESPRWLVLKGQEDEALSVLSALHDRPADDVSSQRKLSVTIVADPRLALCFWRVHSHQGYSSGDVSRKLP